MGWRETGTHPGEAWQSIIEEKGLTVTEAALMTGLRPYQLRRVLDGDAAPSAALTVRFARGVGASSRLLWQLSADYQLAQAEAGHVAKVTG